MGIFDKLMMQLIINKITSDGKKAGHNKRLKSCEKFCLPRVKAFCLQFNLLSGQTHCK